MSEPASGPHSPVNLLDDRQIESARQTVQKIQDGLRQVLFGIDEIARFTLIGLLAGGHVLLEGLPGLGKTQLVRSLSQLVGLQFRRLQFTPDLLPSDITGSHILSGDSQSRRFEFHPGPIFGNLILADEINRASPKTQSALLEAMQEHCATVLGEPHPLPQPFFVLATQNPIELEGTYPLPEAQLDRFALKILLPPASEAAMTRIILERKGRPDPILPPVADRNQIIQLVETTREVAIATAVAEYIAAIVARTSPESNPGSLLRYGAGPRAALSLAQNARAHALLEGRPHVGFDDVQAVVHATLRHRIGLSHTARLDGATTDQALDKIIESIPVQGRDLPKSLAESKT
ncbi:MAG: AAA family ATPase [Verrucomicrobiae bacterium]|nr:AAA family ATPase [Verrucomicrobiae bacterium]